MEEQLKKLDISLKTEAEIYNQLQKGAPAAASALARRYTAPSHSL